MLSVNELSIRLDTFSMEQISLEIRTGEVVSLLGPSGAGKSTILKIIAGLHQLDSGQIIHNNEDITKWDTGKRNIIYLHQKAVLFPHLSVKKNIQLALESQGRSKDYIHEQVAFWSKELDIEDQLNKKPNQLSGGQQQRVALARAFVLQPDYILLDEPFHALDPDLKWNILQTVKSIFQSTKMSCLLVTHDMQEALYLSDRYYYLDHGNISVFDNDSELKSAQIMGIDRTLDFWKNHF